MKKLDCRGLVLAGLVAFLASASAGRSDVIDWDTLPWATTSAPYAIQYFDLNGDSVNDISIETASFSGPTTWTASAAPNTGGLFPEKALQAGVAGSGSGSMRLIFLAGGLYDSGVQNLNCSLFGVDAQSGPADDVWTWGADTISPIITPVILPTVIPTPPYNSASLTGSYQEVLGLIPSDPGTSQGTAAIVFGSTRLNVFCVYAVATSDDGFAIGDISFAPFDFSPVPEAGTVAACVVASLIGAWGLRRMRKAQTLSLEA